MFLKDDYIVLQDEKNFLTDTKVSVQVSQSLTKEAKTKE